MKKLIVILMALIAYSTQALADKVSFTASAPDVVVVGDQFRLSYTVTTQKVKDFQAPSIKGFDVLMGPSRSQQSSTQIMNGNVTSTSSITFTYILMANTAGEYTIPGASIVADGNQMVSNSVKVCHKTRLVMEDKMTVAHLHALHLVQVYLIRICLSRQLPVKRMYTSRKHLS